MKLSDLKVILQRLGVSEDFLTPTKPNQLLVPCPLAKYTHKKGMDTHPSCSIRFGDPVSPTLYHCFSCFEGGKLWDLVHSIGQFANDQALVELGLKLLQSDEPSLLIRLEHVCQGFSEWVYTPKVVKLRELSEGVLANYPPAYAVQGASIYLQKRRVTQQMSSFWDLRWHLPHNRVIFPVRNRRGGLVGGVGRAIGEDTLPKYYNFFGFEASLSLGGLHLVQGHPRVAVVEGYHDLMNVWRWNQQSKIDTVCTFTAGISEAQAAELQRLDATVLVLYDCDDAGERGWVKAKKFLSNACIVRRVRWANILLDIGDMDEVQYGNVLRSID